MMAPIHSGGRWWTVPVNVAATVAWRLPGALMGAVLVVVVGSMLGPPGFLLAVVWLVAGLVTLTRFGERLLARRCCGTGLLAARGSSPRAAGYCRVGLSTCT